MGQCGGTVAARGAVRGGRVARREAAAGVARGGQGLVLVCPLGAPLPLNI